MFRSMANAIESRYTLENNTFLASIGETQPWTTKLDLNGHPMTFKIKYKSQGVTFVSERE